MNKQSRSAHVIVALILAIGLAGALSYLYWQNYTSSSQEGAVESKATDERGLKTNQSINGVNKHEESESIPEAVPGNWKKYENKGVAFSYPSEWIVREVSYSSDIPDDNVDASEFINDTGYYGSFFKHNNSVGYENLLEAIKNDKRSDSVVEEQNGQVKIINYTSYGTTDKSKKYSNWASTIFIGNNTYTLNLAPLLIDSDIRDTILQSLRKS